MSREDNVRRIIEKSGLDPSMFGYGPGQPNGPAPEPKSMHGLKITFREAEASFAWVLWVDDHEAMHSPPFPNVELMKAHCQSMMSRLGFQINIK